MGKGDKKTRRGKITIGSTGVRRPRKKKTRKPVMLPKPSPVSADIPETAPVVVVPEMPAVAEQVVEKPQKKTSAKAVAKKAAGKTAEGDTTPKQPKARKKATKPAEDPSTEQKEGTE